MIKEIRIYYDCLEQAAHFVKPIVERNMSAHNLSVPIKLVKLVKNYKLFSRNVAPIILWKDPDILITMIVENIEYPLIQIEFSSAVFTEDHELQRFDGFLASVENNCIYVKISPVHKTSQSNHGGNTNYNYLIPYSVIYNKFGRLSFHFEWPCDQNGNLMVEQEFLSCPVKIQPFEMLLNRLLDFIMSMRTIEEGWIEEFEKGLENENYFKMWIDRIKNVSFPELEIRNSSRLVWKEETGELFLKINRFGHAMDPERGMLAFYGTIYANTVVKMIFDEENEAWYKGTNNETSIKNYVERNGLTDVYDFLWCFSLGSGLNQYSEFNRIVEEYKGCKKDYIILDITEFVKKKLATFNKSLKTIFKFSNKFILVDKYGNEKVKFVWDRSSLTFELQNILNITPIRSRDYFDEDDVTYISVHNVLKKNGYRILAVSYPGAQGDRVVLIEYGTGRAQQRRYIDIISYLPSEYTILQENKGSFSASLINKDIKEICNYKCDSAYKNAIDRFLNWFDECAPKTLKVGVGFCYGKEGLTTEHIKKVEIDKLDYFVLINSTNYSWKVFFTGKALLFSETEGKVEIPHVFQICQENPDNYLLFDEL